MDARTARIERDWYSPAGGGQQLARAVAGAILVTLALLAALILWRRACGIPLRPATGMALWMLVGGVALAGVLYRAVLPARGDDRRFFAEFSLPTLVSILWAAALSFPTSPAVDLLGMWGLLVVVEGICWRNVVRSERATVEPLLRRPAVERDAGLDLRAPHFACEPQAASSPLSQGGYQREGATLEMVRHARVDGGEIIGGFVQVAFEPGQRHAAAHIPICPAFDRAPVAYAELSDETAASVSITHALPYGVRLEIKLDRAAEDACTAAVEFSFLSQ